MEIVQIIILALTGLFLTFIGLLRISNPIDNYAKNSGIQLSKDPNLLNEVRGVSAVMLCAGILIGLGAFFPSIRLTSFSIGCLIFLGFALGRMFSLQVDGKPNQQLMMGIAFELVFGGAHLFGVWSVL